jgi:hypothetical protein
MNLRQQNGVIGLEQEVVFQGLLGKKRADEIFESDQSKFFFIKDLYLFQFAEHLKDLLTKAALKCGLTFSKSS